MSKAMTVPEVGTVVHFSEQHLVEPEGNTPYIRIQYENDNWVPLPKDSKRGLILFFDSPIQDGDIAVRVTRIVSTGKACHGEPTAAPNL